jgi:hypothetical protein
MVGLVFWRCGGRLLTWGEDQPSIACRGAGTALRIRFQSRPGVANALFVSVDPAARTDRTDTDLAAAIRIALDAGTPGGVEPLDWLSTTAPRRWRAGAETLIYDWAEPWGAAPLAV